MGDTVTTTLTAPSIDLSWVTWGGVEPGQWCGWRETEACLAKATDVGYFEVPDSCPHETTLYCPAHRDYIVWQVARGRRLFYCTRCTPYTFGVFLRMETLR